MSTHEYSTTPALTRRGILRGLPILALAGATAAPALAAPADSALLRMWETWKALEDERLAAEMACRRIEDARPAEVEDTPKVRCYGCNYYSTRQIDNAIAQTPALAAEMSLSADNAKRIAAKMLMAQVEQLHAVRPVLEDKVARRERWLAESGFNEMAERRDRLSEAAFEVVEKIRATPCHTHQGLLVKLDVAIDAMGETFDPEGDGTWEYLAAAGTDLERMAGMKLSAPGRTEAYRNGSA